MRHTAAKPLSPQAVALTEHIRQTQNRAVLLERVLYDLLGSGPQCTWLGSRTLGPKTAEYKWTAEVAKLLAEQDIAHKTGGHSGLMEAPHYGCHLAKRPDLVIAIGADFIHEPFNQYVTDKGYGARVSDFNSRHDCLFFGSLFYIVLPGRLGTYHEELDLLNRLKHDLLTPAPVYLVEREGYYSSRVKFLTNCTGRNFGPRISEADYATVKIIDLSTMDPSEFVALVLADISRK